MAGVEGCGVGWGRGAAGGMRSRAGEGGSVNKVSRQALREVTFQE